MSLGFPTVIMGVDPGRTSMAICVLKNGTVSDIWQYAAKGKEKEQKAELAKKFTRVFRNALVTAKPVVCGIEGVEAQAWRTGGRIPKGLHELDQMVTRLEDEAHMLGVTVYRQSPELQADYPTEVVVQMLQQAMGKDYPISPHLVSATKHALAADSKYHLVKSQLPRM